MIFQKKKTVVCFFKNTVVCFFKNYRYNYRYNNKYNKTITNTKAITNTILEYKRTFHERSTHTATPNI